MFYMYDHRDNCVGVLIMTGLLYSIFGLYDLIVWIFEANSIKSRLTNVSTSVFFALIGVLVLYWYRPRIEIRRQTGRDKTEHIFKNTMS